MKFILMFIFLWSSQTRACDQHLRSERAIVMSEEMQTFWYSESLESQLETIKQIEKLLNHYLNHSKLSMEVNLRVFAGYMMYRLNGECKSWPKGKDLPWLRSFLSELMNHPATNLEFKQRLMVLYQMYL